MCSTASPPEGESLTLEGKEATAKLTVVRMDRHRIDRVKLVLTPKPSKRKKNNKKASHSGGLRFALR